MSFSAIPPVGQRIREERTKRGLSVRGLARAIGVSASLISQIETGRSRPSVSTLYGITRALGISLEDVFGFDAEPEPAALIGSVPGSTTVPASPVDPQAAAATRPALLDRISASYDGPLVRPEHREILELDSGVRWERLGRVPGVHVDFLLVTYAPGGSSSTSGQLMRHAGVEYGYLSEGELVLTLGFDEYKLAPGDAVAFQSSTPHRYRNDGAVPAVGVWFQPSASFDTAW